MAGRDWETEVRAVFGEANVSRSADGFFWVQVGPEGLRAAVVALKERLGITNLSSIIAEDLREHYLLSYPFLGEVVVTLQVRVERDVPEVPSLADTVAGAVVYEREVRDVMGITPLGHPDLRRQVLPEGWPEGVYPLRKDAVLPPASTE